MGETEVPWILFGNPIGCLCCCGLCIFKTKMDEREAFLDDKIKEFNERIAHPKGLEIRWNEDYRKFDRARGGRGKQFVIANDKEHARSMNIQSYEVGLDLVKLPNKY